MPGQLRPNPARPLSTARPRHGAGLSALPVMLAAVLCAHGAAAQGTTVVGEGGMPSVEINLDAIDGGTRAPRTPSGARYFGAQDDQPIRLKPPKGMASPSLRPLARPSPPPAPRPLPSSPAVVPAPVKPVARRVEPAPPPAAPAMQDRTAMPTVVPRAADGQPAAPPTSAMPAPRAPGAATAARPMAPAAQQPTSAQPVRPAPVPPPPVAKPAPPLVQAAKPVPPPPPPVPKAAPAPKAMPVPKAVAVPKALPAQEPAAKAAPPARQAALPKATAPLPEGKAMQIMFAEGSSALSAEATATLGSLADQMARSDQRIQLKAIADSASGASPSATRRLSFSRALAVRAFLIERGVRSTRIDVRTLGSPEGDGPTERVDVILLPR